MQAINHKTKIFFAVILVLTLGACGGSETKIIEREPILVDHDDHDHDHDHDDDHDHAEARGRLLISAKDTAQVFVIDVAEKTLIDEFATTAIPSAIYTSPSYRYGYIVQRNADRVDIIDGGLWQEDHADHLHDYVSAPVFMGFHLTEARPTHFTQTATQTVIFFDGNAETATPASVGVFTDGDIVNNSGGIWLHYTTHMHGAAQAREDYLISTERDSTSETTLPDKVALYHAHDDHFDQEMIFAETCDGLHGSAQTHDAIAFGCTDGILVIDQEADVFTARKISNPEEFSEGMRIGTLLAVAQRDTMVGIAAGKFFAVDLEAETITPIVWTESEIAAQSYGFTPDGDVFIILDSNGVMTVLAAADWTLVRQIPVITNVADLPEGSKWEMTFAADNETAFVSDPVSQQIKVVNLASGDVEDISLDFTPHKLTWLGIPAPAEAHDDH